MTPRGPDGPRNNVQSRSWDRRVTEWSLCDLERSVRVSYVHFREGSYCVFAIVYWYLLSTWHGLHLAPNFIAQTRELELFLH